MDKKNLSINVIVADDHQLFRQGVITSLRTLNFISRIAEASNGKEVIDILEKNPYEIVLMDISMPEMGGEQATRIIRNKFPSVKVIALTMWEDESHIMEMVRAGVHGYLLKNTSRAEIEKAVLKVLSGDPFYSAEVSEILLSRATKNDRNEKEDIKDHLLTKREIEIIRLIYQEMTNKEIAEKLYLTIATIESHRNNIFHKTNSKNTVGLLKYALKNGIIK